MATHRLRSLLRKEDKSKRCKVTRVSGKIYYKGILFTRADEVQDVKAWLKKSEEFIDKINELALKNMEK
jgi:hypothetical protein